MNDVERAFMGLSQSRYGPAEIAAIRKLVLDQVEAGLSEPDSAAVGVLDPGDKV